MTPMQIAELMKKLDEIHEAIVTLGENDHLRQIVLDVANGDGHTVQMAGALISKCDTYGRIVGY